MQHINGNGERQIKIKSRNITNAIGKKELQNKKPPSSKAQRTMARAKKTQADRCRNHLSAKTQPAGAVSHLSYLYYNTNVVFMSRDFNKNVISSPVVERSV